MSEKRAIDLLTQTFDLNQRRKYTINKPDGSPLIDLYFKPITRANRIKVQKLADPTDALKQSTMMLIEMAEKENGQKAFVLGDIAQLQSFIPENILNEIELFLFGIENETSLEEAKK